MFSSQVSIPFIITLLAGLSTCIGAVIVILKRSLSNTYISVSLAFSTGVMVFLSFNEILPEGREILSNLYGGQGMLLAFGLFFAGVLLTALIDKCVPLPQNPHELNNTKMDCLLDEETLKKEKLKRMGLFTAIVIMLHNFPEGIATFMTSMNDLSMGIPMALAVALHNIPEGIVVAVPILCGTGSKGEALKYAVISGLAEPLGAILTYLLLMPYFSPALYGAVMSMVAGIMVYISFDELLPAAQEYGAHHIIIWSLMGGMLVMSLLMVII